MRIAVIPGDGIGKDVTAEAVKVLNAVGERFGRAFELEHLPWGADYFLETGITIPPNGYDMLRDEFDAIFIGALGDPRVPDNRHARDILLGTRFELDLYVNYRPVKLLDERLCPLKGRGPADVNFVVFRENTEGLYVGIGGRFKAGHRRRDRDPGGAQHLEGRAPDRPPRVRVREVARPDEGVHGRQEQRHDRTGTRSGSACSARWRRSIPGIEADALLHRRARDVHGARPGAVPGDRHQQPVRRHRHGPRRDVPGRARAWRRRATSIPGRTSMFEPVHGSAPKFAGQEHREPDRRDRARRR